MKRLIVAAELSMTIVRDILFIRGVTIHSMNSGLAGSTQASGKKR